MELATFLYLLFIVFVVWSNSSFAPVGKNVGFFCNDTSISEPYHGDSISLSVLLSSVILGPSVVIYVSELLFKEQTSENTNRSIISFKWLAKLYHYGLSFVVIITEVLKVSCGELRPHFFTTCQPDMENIKCSDGYITNFNCTRDIPHWLKRDMYKSFPSGHAALSTYTFMFLSIYVHSFSKNVTQMSLKCWKAFVVVTFLMWSVVCCISRLMDRRHFWWDVLFGIFMGLTGGLLMGQWCIYKSSQGRVKKK